jgi:hypothetical protein
MRTNPIPSPDGKYIAYVRTGWGEGVFTSFGRSSLVSEVKIMSLEPVHLPLLTALDLSAAVSPRTLARNYFTSGLDTRQLRASLLSRLELRLGLDRREANLGGPHSE